MLENLDLLSADIRRQDSTSDRIADMIRKLILNGELESGQRIVESRWAKQLGVGQPTMREALVALEHEGLVMRRANQGAEVVSLNNEELSQALRIRAELEEIAVEMAAECASPESLKRMKALAKEMLSAARSRNAEDFFARDREWHETLWAATGNIFLERMLGQLMSPLLAFLFLRNLRLYSQFDLRAVAQAHIDMVEAMATRDARRARKVAHEKFISFASDHAGALRQV